MEEDNNKFESIAQDKHEQIWATEIEGKRRIISQGDLKYDTNQDVLVVLPFYYDKIEKKVCQMAVVSGVIIDIIYVRVKQNQLIEIPRETKLRSSPENTSIYTGEKEWAKKLIIHSPRENTDNAIQTYVVKYKIELDEDHVLDKHQLNQVYKEFRSQEHIPFDYDLYVKNNTISVDYRYIMGPTYDCQKLLGSMIRKDAIDIK